MLRACFPQKYQDSKEMPSLVASVPPLPIAVVFPAIERHVQLSESVSPQASWSHFSKLWSALHTPASIVVSDWRASAIIWAYLSWANTLWWPAYLTPSIPSLNIDILRYSYMSLIINPLGLQRLRFCLWHSAKQRRTYHRMVQTD